MDKIQLIYLNLLMNKNIYIRTEGGLNLLKKYE